MNKLQKNTFELLVQFNFNEKLINSILFNYLTEEIDFFTDEFICYCENNQLNYNHKIIEKFTFKLQQKIIKNTLHLLSTN